MNKEEVEKIIDYVKCPQLGSLDYGKWGALRLEQRIKINDLCLSWLLINENDMKNNKRIDKAIEILKLCNSKCSKEVIEILKGE